MSPIDFEIDNDRQAALIAGFCLGTKNNCQTMVARESAKLTVGSYNLITTGVAVSRKLLETV
jgi:hypothetical protein